MHTVIITDRHTTPLFGEYRQLFAPFLTERGGSVCHCSWNEAGTDIEDAVPDLYGLIRGHPEWRVIVLFNPAVHSELLPFKPENPFDFDCNRASTLLIQENPAPLVRLTHMLAGYPSLGVKGYDMGYAYFNAKADKFELCYDKNENPVFHKNLLKLSEEERNAIIVKVKTKYEKYGNLNWRMMEVPYSDKEKEDYKKLKKKYALKEERPVEILLLSTREVFAADDRDATREAVRHAWEFYDEQESSDFWKMYPNTCRFLCYDLINPEHTLYQRDLWRFFLLSLTLAFNDIPGQALQAYHLYKADLKINTDELRQVFEERIENMQSLKSIIQERMLRSPELTQEKKKELVPTQNISVKFEQVDESDVMANEEKFGLASDCPISETQFWNDHIQGTKLTIDNILSAPQEIAVNKALETRRKTYDFSGREQVLDRFQIERIHKHIDELEATVINANVYGMLDTDKYIAEVTEAGDDVRKNMGFRLTKRNVLLISVFSLLIYLCGYTPYLINSAKTSMSSLGASVGLVIVSLVLLAAGGLLTLWFLRLRLMNMIKTYNKTVRAIFDRVNNGAKVYSDYFSSVCTYMYARSLLSGVILKHDNDFIEKKIQNAHLAVLESEIAKGKELCTLFEVPVSAALKNETFISVNENLLSQSPANCQLYELLQYKSKNTVELGNTGETLNAPYSFIAGISLVREELYNKKGA